MPRANSYKNEQKYKLEKFGVALKHAEFASEQLWHIFQIFILAHTIFILFLGNIILSQKGESALDKSYLVSVLLIGILMCFMWLGTYFRTRGYYDFRLAQASEIEPKELKLLRDRGHRFAEGECIEIEGVHFRMGFWARWLRMKWTMPVFITTFFVFYIILLFQIIR